MIFRQLFDSVSCTYTYLIASRRGSIPGALHVPYGRLNENLADGSLLRELATTGGKRLVFFSAYGERSAMAVGTAQAAGLAKSSHLKGGIDAWKKTGGPFDLHVPRPRSPDNPIPGCGGWDVEAEPVEHRSATAA